MTRDTSHQDSHAEWLAVVIYASMTFFLWLAVTSVATFVLTPLARVVVWTAAVWALISLSRRIDSGPGLLQWSAKISRRQLLALVASALAVLWGSTWLLALLAGPEAFAQPMASDLPTHGFEEWLASFVFAAIFAPLAEEVVFRGAIQRHLMIRFGTVIGIVLTAALFAAFHGRNGIMMFKPFIGGLIFGYVVYLAGSVWCAVLVHAMGNGIPLLVASLTPLGTLTPWDAPAVTAGVTACAIALGVYGLVRAQTAPALSNSIAGDEQVTRSESPPRGASSG